MFSLLTSTHEKIAHLLADNKSARAFDACILLSGEKSRNCDPENKADLAACFSRLGDYFIDNFDSIIDTVLEGIFAMRSFLKVVGKIDLVEATTTSNNKTTKKAEFSLKNYELKVMPEDWNFGEYIKKFYKKIKDKNMLGK